MYSMLLPIKLPFYPVYCI